MAALGLRFVFDTFLTADHLTLATNDNYQPLADYLGTYRVDSDPPHVTYVVDPQTDSTRAGVVADHAYWLSGLRVRDTGADPTGTVDAVSSAFGQADPVPSGGSGSAGILTGAHLLMPYLQTGQTWKPAASTTPRNALALHLTDVGRATVDGARAKLSGDKPLTLTIDSDGPAQVTVALPLPAGTTLTTATGPAPLSSTVTTTGVTLDVGPGSSTFTLTPPQH
ncbi:hypothetical protein POF50_000120 [Streptomyces sp. SL13]|uniref:Uncharacterized protein n=1 Tax=Streptantibioticus silvisoli TaxID=2705255 RepID=A0AA90GY90_9ACTN|nr:hypothetical protein [Streptantibioticus silvisoli]MDI5967771.1 hypothetical protein [Streptantibioticus silvisoli]